jgi:4-oxalmesaconate hydratase
MIIDCHGHYTTAPKTMALFRQAQINLLKDPTAPPALRPQFSDDEIRETLEPAQLRLQRERGIDMALFSPGAGKMSHHIGTFETSLAWSQLSNDLIAQACRVYPQSFVGVCQLPQSPGVDPATCIPELERCVSDLGFVGCNINPDPSGGYWTGVPMTDRAWYPLYEKMVELDVPGMIHVAASCNPNFHGTGAHYLCGDTTVFMQLLLSDLFTDFPTLRFIIPHGGGAVPYHWGRYRGLSAENKKRELEPILDNVFFDTCVYHQPGINLLTEVIPVENVLFASEMVGAVKGKDPRTGQFYDDTRRYIDNRPGLTDADRAKIFEGNARRVYPRLNALLEARAK